MMNFFKKLNKYSNAQLWIEQAQIREEKRQTVQPFLMPVELSQPPVNILATQTRTVFRKEDKGRTQDDTKKIQTLYHELEDVMTLPSLSFT